MNKKLKHIVLTLSSASVITLPIVAAVSATDSDEFGGIDEDFSGNFSSNNYLNIVKNGQNQNDSAIFGNLFPSMDKNNLEWNSKMDGYEVYQNWNGNYTTSPNGGWSTQIKNKHYNGVVYLEEITPWKEGETPFYDISKTPRRKWRATFNNWFVPADPNKDGLPNANWNYRPDAYGNLSYGLMLSRNLQLVDNSVRIVIQAKDHNYNPVSLPNTPNVKGYVTYLVDKDDSKPANEGNIYIPNPQDPTDRSKVQTFSPSQFQSSRVTLNSDFESKFRNPYLIPGDNQWASNSSTYNTPFTLNNIMYQTVDPNYKDNISKVQDLFNGNANQTGDPNAPWQTSLGTLLYKGNPNSALNKNINDMGSMLFFQVTTGSWWYRDNNSYQPTVVVEFETVDNQDTLNINGNNEYTYKTTNNGGITALFTGYRGNSGIGGGGNFVAAHSVSYTRTKYRTINVKVQERAINSPYGSNNAQQNYYIPSGYGYKLFYDGKEIGHIPANLVNQAKINNYDNRTQNFTINLAFNSDTTTWPQGMLNSYGEFMDPNKLVLQRDWEDALEASFFTDNPDHSISAMPQNNGAKNIGGTFLDPNSLKKTGEITFYSDFQWLGKDETENLGYSKLKLMEMATEPSSDNLLAPQGSIYAGTNYNYVNTTLLQNQQGPFRNTIYNDWKVNHFTNNSWWTLYNDLKQSDYNATTAVNNAEGMLNIEAYNKKPTSTDQNVVDTKNFLNYDNYLSTDKATSLKINNFANFSFAPEELKKQYMAEYNKLVLWNQLPAPEYNDTDANNVVDTNNTAQKIKDIVDSYNVLYNKLQSEKSTGFEADTPLTAQEFLQEAFKRIDQTSIYSQAYKNAFKTVILQQTDRATVIKYVNAIVTLDKNYLKAKETYDKFLPVLSNEKYVNIQNFTGEIPGSYQKDATFIGFEFVMGQAQEVLNVIEQYKTNTVNPEFTTIKKIETNTLRLNPELIEQKYASITTDITSTIAKINALTKLTKHEKQSYIANLWNLVANGKPAAEFNQQLENYEAREKSIALILVQAMMTNQIRLESDKFSELNEEYSLNVISEELTNSIQKAPIKSSLIENQIGGTNSEIEVISSANNHKNWTTVKDPSGNMISIFPNTTAASASVNYVWQPAAKYFLNGQAQNYPTSTETFSYIDRSVSKKLGTYLLDNFLAQLNNQANAAVLNTYKNVMKFYDTYNQMVQTFTTTSSELFAKYDDAENTKQDKTNVILNEASYTALLADLYKNYFVQRDYANLSNADDQNIISTWNNSVNTLTNKFKALKALVNKIFTDSPFLNGQFYGITNLDKFAFDQGAYTTFILSQNNSDFIALLSAAMQVLQMVPDKINGIVDNNLGESAILQAQGEKNLPSVLRTTTFSVPTDYIWYAYTPTQVETLMSSLNDAYQKLDGRYRALNNFLIYVNQKFFSQIDNNATQLYTTDEAITFTNSLNLSAVKNTLLGANPDDSKYYVQLSNFVLEKAKAYINSLQNLSQSDKTSLIDAISTIGTINFNDFDAKNTTQPQWYWKVQATLYQAAQINDAVQSLRKHVNSDAKINQIQKDALLKQITDLNLFNANTLNITSKDQALASSFIEVNKILYTPAEITALKETISKLDAEMEKLRNFFTNSINPNKIGTANPSNLYKNATATSKEAFDTAFNKIATPDTIAIIDPENLGILLGNAIDAFNELNGYNETLKQDFANSNDVLKNFVTTAEFNKVAQETSTDPIISSQQGYNQRYSEGLNKLVDAVANKIDALTHLTQAQKEILKAKANELKTQPNATFDSLVPIIQEANALDEQMNELKKAQTAAKQLISDNQVDYNNLTSSDKADLDKALAETDKIFGPFNEENAQSQSLSKDDAYSLTQKIQDLTNKVQKELLASQIKNELNKVTESSPEALKTYKEETLNKIKDLNNLTAEQLGQILKETQNKVMLQPLYQAIQNANAVESPSAELTQAIQEANRDLNNLVNDADLTSAKVQEATDKLNNAIKLDTLNKEIAKAETIQTPSKVLQQALTSAKQVANDKETAKYDENIKALQDAILKDPLNKALEEATEANEKLQSGELFNAIEKAKNTLEQEGLTPEQVATAAQELRDAITKAQLHSEAQKALEDKIKEAETINADSAQPLKDIIAGAKEVLANPNATTEDYSNALSQLEFALKLDKIVKVNNAAKEKVSEDQRSNELNQAISNADEFINKWSELIKANNSNLADLMQSEQFDTKEAELIKELYITTNGNALYNYANETNNSVVAPTNEALTNLYSNFTKNASELSAKIPSLVSSDKFDDLTQTNPAHAELEKQMLANKAYYEMNNIVASLPAESEENPRSELLKNAIKDANTITGVQNDTISFTNPSELTAPFETIKDNLTQQALKDLANNPLDMIIKAETLLKNARAKNNLALQIASANAVKEILEHGHVDESNKTRLDLTLDQKKELLNTALEEANTALSQNDKDDTYYNEAAEKLAKAEEIAAKFIKDLKDKLTLLVTKANEQTTKTPALEAEIPLAQKLLENDGVQAKDLIDEIYKMAHLLAKNKLQELINQTSDNLKNSESFKEMALAPANAIIANDNASLKDLEKAITKYESNLKKDKLFEAYDLAKDAIKPLSEELNALLTQSKNMLEDKDDTYLEASKATFDTQADKLLQALRKNNLLNLINQTENSSEPMSDDLQAALNNAKEVAKTIDANTPEVNYQAANKLQTALNANKLNNALQNAKDTLAKFTAKEGQSLNEEATQIKTALEAAIAKAQEAANNPLQSKDYYDKFADELNTVVKADNKVFNDAKEAFENKLAQIKAAIANKIIVPSNKLKETLAKYETMPENPNYMDYVNGLKDITFASNANDLANAVENFVSPDKNVENINPEILNQAKELLNNKEATSEALNKLVAPVKATSEANNALNVIAQKQNLNNAQMQALNNALKEAYKTYNISAEDMKEAADAIVQNATDLDNKMKELSDYINSLSDTLKNDPITSLKYTYADDNLKTAYKDALDKALNVLKKDTGTVVGDNQASEINDYLENLKKALAALNGKENLDKIKSDAETKLNNLKALENSNQFVNAPEALQNAYKEAIKNAQTALDTVNSMVTASDKTNTDNLATALENLQKLADEINKFPDTKYEVNNTPATHVDKVLSELNNLSQAVKDTIKENFNKATTFEEANKILQDAIKQNASLGNEVNGVKDAISNIINNLPATSKDQINNIQEQINKIAASAKPEIVDALNNLVNGLNNFDALNDALKAYKNSNTKSSKYQDALNNLQNAIQALASANDDNPLTSDLANTFNEKADDIKLEANNIINLVNALQNKDQKAFNEAINNLSGTENGEEYLNFGNVLNDNKYFDILNTPDNKYTKEQVEQLQNILLSKELQKMPLVVKSTIIKDIKAASHGMPWWAYVVISTSILWLAAMILIVSHKRK
ncbi:coiled-coil domain-containing protein [Mycoplasma sp. VS1572C]